MPANTELARKIWARYAYCRDNGHQDFITKADKCEKFLAGDQWNPADKAMLARAKRPALTINKILSTVSNVLGEQIYNRSEVSFRPRNGAPEAVAGVLTKVFKHVSDNNQLDWKRSDMFADGVITSRGYLDMRMDFGESMTGEIAIEVLNPKNVVVDPDAEHYDPDKWNDVCVTKWVTVDDIELLYSKADAELLKSRDQSVWEMGYDSIEQHRDRIGTQSMPGHIGPTDERGVLRNIRVLERQYRVLDKQKHFVSPMSGETRPIPDGFDRDRIAFFTEKLGLRVINKLVRRIKWTAVADDIVLHDDWSPYKHFTVIPYFPHFRHGRTIGLVENLLDPQELLNKTSSQELHVINTSANSGWKFKTGSLTNMNAQDLEERGATTGIAIEMNGDLDQLEKIQPNQVPTGLDRVSYKAEEHIKTISGVSDSMQGFDREDVAAKAIQAKRQAGSTNMAKPLDSLVRSDYILARNAVDLIQEFYTEERMLSITHDNLAGDTETFTINQADAYGQIVNDLTVGEYSIVVSSVPRRETLEDVQFEQAVALKEMGLAIPDSVILDASRLNNKAAVLKQMQGDQESPEGRAAAALASRAKEAEVSKAEGEAATKHADAGLKGAKTEETIVKAQVLANKPPEAPQGDADPALARDVATQKADLDERRFEHEKQVDFMAISQKREEADNKMALQAQQAAQDRADRRVAASQQAAAAAQNQQTRQPTKGLR